MVLPRLSAGLLLLLPLAALSCARAPGCDEEATLQRGAVARADAPATGDVDEIRERGTLRVLLHGDEPELLQRRGSPIHLERELAAAFAASLGVALEPVLIESFEDLFAALRDGKGDLLAASLAVTEARADEVSFTAPVRFVDELLVGKRGTPDLPASPEDLEGRTVVVQRATSYAETLTSLEPAPAVRFADGRLDDEELVQLVGAGELPLTVVDSDLFEDIKAYNHDVVALFPVRERRPIAFALRQESPALKALADRFLLEHALTERARERFTGDLEGIKRRGVLRVLTRNNAVTYFLHKGRARGFELELAEAMAKELGVRLEVIVPPTAGELVPWLLEGRGDVIAAAFTKTPGREAKVSFSEPYLWVDEILVGRAGAKPLASVAELAGARISVRPASSYARTLGELRQNVPLRVDLVDAHLETEEIIARVAEGELALTVADSHLLAMEQTYRDDVAALLTLTRASAGATDAIGKPVPGAKPIAFAVRPESPALKGWLDAFVKRHYRGVLWGTLHKRYFEEERTIRVAREESLKGSGRLSEHDELLHELAERYDLDWRLVAAQAYQESRLDPGAESWVGARGLLQVMPATAAELGLSLDSLEEATHAGVRYLSKMIAAYDEEDLPPAERMRFALASYNVGRGHVLDARRLAAQLGKDPNVWFGNVERALLKLQEPRYANKARHGWCRGEEPVRYVAQIQARYDEWVRLLPASPG